MSEPVLHMQWIDWTYMKEKHNPVFDEVIPACEFHGLKELMELEFPWNKEVICQFFSTVYFSVEGEKEITWLTGEDKYSVT